MILGRDGQPLLYEGDSDCSDDANSRWDIPLRPGEHPRAWATALGFPADVIEDVAVDFMGEPEYAQFATPMLPGESVRVWAVRVGYPPTRVDEIVLIWHDEMHAPIKAKALARWRLLFCVVCFLGIHARAVVSANAPSRKRERGEFNL